jgi:hypothetical protein
MKRIAAQDIAAWLKQELVRSATEGEQGIDGRHRLQCIVELRCYWQGDGATEEFFLQLELVAHASTVSLVSASYAALDVECKDDTMPANDRFVRLRLDQPLVLECVHIAKPWGQEIWYTGVEERGVCGLQGVGGSVPLPWLLESLSPFLTGGQRELVLLKILDPLPEEVWGDLYFELHEEKQEVYVVTNVDGTAWPDGIGAIRFGFDPEVLQRYDDDAEFKQDFRQSVAAYEAVRREIDDELDERRREHGIALDAALEPRQLAQWQQGLPAELLLRERELRMAMEAYSLFKPLRVGDVVKVPCFTPHSLQHGVRTVEFQTPVYERKILSFAQKVLTQGHWDTDDAVSLMQLQVAEEAPFSVVRRSASVLVECIVDFDDFKVQRWRLQPNSSDELALDGGAYALVMVVDGAVQVGGVRLQAEQACLVTQALGSVLIGNASEWVITVLVAFPVVVAQHEVE